MFTFSSTTTAGAARRVDRGTTSSPRPLPTRSCSATCWKTRIFRYAETRRAGVAHRDNMGSSSNNRIAALTLWIVGASVALALLGSSTLLFPGPDVGGRASTPPGRDIVARVVAPIFGPSPVRRETTPAPAAPAAPAGTFPSESVAVAFVPAAPVPFTERNPIGGVQVAPDKPSIEQAPEPARNGKRTKSTGGKAVAAGAKSQGHGHLKSEPPRGPKQTHVRPAKGKGKSPGRARGHARAGR
jgi:hypothetical protein